MNPPAVTLGKVQATLVKPSPLLAVGLQRTSEQWEVMGQAELWALGSAALFASWPTSVAWPVRPCPKPWQVKEPILKYGHAIFDGLVNAGIPPVQLFPILTEAIKWASLSVLGQDDVDSAENFSAPLPGA